MNLDPGMISKVLNALPYPVGKADLIAKAQNLGANDQIVHLLDGLPDKTFNSAEEVQNAVSGLGNLGSLGNLGNIFKR